MLTKKQLQVLRLLVERELNTRAQMEKIDSLYAEFLRRLIDSIDGDIPEAPNSPEMDMSSITLVTHRKSPKNGG